MKVLFAFALIALISQSIAGGVSNLGKPPVNQVVPVVYRDFLGNGYTGPVIVTPRPNPLPTHPDFNNVKKVDTGIVTNTLVNGEPVYAPGATGTSVSTHGQAYFNDWYNPSSYDQEVDSTITFVYVPGNSSWTHSSYRNFFPLNGIGWGDQLADGNGNLQNFGFTMQLSHYFWYHGNEYLTVGCDDDCFVYVNGQLAINFGGIHEIETGTIDFTTMGFSLHEKIFVDIFYAERHVPWATFNLDTNIFFGGFSGGADPHFTGLSGEKYDLMGQANTWFNLFTDTNFQLNAYFVQGCASKPEMTTMGSVAFLIGDHRIHLDITCNATLDETTNLIKVGTSVPIGKYGMISHVAPQVYIVDTNDYTIRVNPFILDPHYQVEGKPFHGADCVKGYFNVDIEMKNENTNPHGILGQTAHHKHTDAELDAKPKSSQGEGEIEGVYTDYIVSGMYATDNKFSRYSFNPNVADYVAAKSKREVAFDPLEHTYQELVKFMEDSCPK